MDLTRNVLDFISDQSVSGGAAPGASVLASVGPNKSSRSFGDGNVIVRQPETFDDIVRFLKSFHEASSWFPRIMQVYYRIT